MAYKAISELTEVSALTGDELLEVSQLSGTVTITATTISALASDNSFNDSASGFVTAGFAAGDRVTVEGFTTNAVNNLFTGVITALVAAKMTIGGTDGDVIVDESAGDSVTITKWTTRRVDVDDLPKPDFSVSVFAPGEYTDGQRLAGVLIPVACTIPADLAGSLAKVFEANPTSSAVISLKKNGTEFGTITFATDGTPTLAAESATSFNGTSDYLEITGPATADTTLAGVNINLLATRS